MKFFILAGGRGERAQPLSFFLPKPLFPLAGKPLLARQLELLRRLKVSSGFINIHHLAEKFGSFQTGESGLTVFYEEELSGTLILKKAAALAPDDEIFLVLNGDTFLQIPLQEMKEAFADRCEVLLLVVYNNNPLYQKLLIRQDLLTGFAPEKREGFSYAGCALMRASFLKRLQRRNFFQDIFEQRVPAKIFAYRKEWIEFTSAEAYFCQNWNYLKNRGRRQKNLLSAGAQIAAGISLEHSIVWPDVKITGCGRLKECIVVADTVVNHDFEQKIIAGDSCYELKLNQEL